jgi:uncharacterized protein YecE (DUF72 family)
VRVLAGASGFSYAAWDGAFHPPRLPAGDRLAHCATRLDTVELGERLGPVLYQLPPSLPRDVGLLRAFLAGLPRGSASAWLDDAVLQALADAGAALCAAETDDGATPLAATAPFGYLRLRRAAHGAADLARWAERILARPWREAFVYFKHEDAARGPGFALALRDLARRGRAGASGRGGSRRAAPGRW